MKFHRFYTIEEVEDEYHKKQSSSSDLKMHQMKIVDGRTSGVIKEVPTMYNTCLLGGIVVIIVLLIVIIGLLVALLMK